MIRSFYRSKNWALWAYGGGALLIASLWIQVQITVAINKWYGGFYNLLQTSAEYQNKQAEDLMFNGLTIKEVKVLIDSLNWHIDQKKKGYRSVFD